MNFARSPSCSASTMAAGLGIDRRQLGFIGERVRPVSALLDPTFDGVDLFRLERAGGGHLHSVVGAGYTVEQEAVLGAARHDAAAIDHRALAVQPHAAGRLRPAVARDTVLAQDRQNIFGEIYFGSRLSRQQPYGCHRAQHGQREFGTAHNIPLKAERDDRGHPPVRIPSRNHPGLPKGTFRVDLFYTLSILRARDSPSVTNQYSHNSPWRTPSCPPSISPACHASAYEWGGL